MRAQTTGHLLLEERLPLDRLASRSAPSAAASSPNDRPAETSPGSARAFVDGWSVSVPLPGGGELSLDLSWQDEATFQAGPLAQEIARHAGRQTAAVIVLQAAGRGWLARRRAAFYRKRRQERAVAVEVAAIRSQAVRRGEQARAIANELRAKQLDDEEKAKREEVRKLVCWPSHSPRTICHVPLATYLYRAPFATYLYHVPSTTYH